jgi:hypothetical protein
MHLVPSPFQESGLSLRRISCFALLALLAFAGCTRRAESQPPAAQTSSSVTPHAPSVAAAESWEESTLPSREHYSGSAVCRDCHAKKYESWSHDWHARALSPGERQYVAGNFEHAHFKGTSSEAWMSRDGARYTMRTRDASGTLADYPVQWLVGGKRMQDAVTVLPDGRWQVLPIYFHVTGHGAWVDYNEAKQGPITPAHPHFWTNFRRMAAKECLECHTTGLDVQYKRETHSWATSFIDPGVACEACHGPGARHAETKAKADVVHPAHLPKDAQMALCGRCHGPREPIFPKLDPAHQFRPGDRYDDYFQALVIVDGTDRSGEFFADGRPSSSTFEYQALLQSRCQRVGGATCLTCHTAPHEPHGANEIKETDRHADPNASCRDCHASISGNAAAHSHHTTAAGQSCVACHMPPLLSGVLDKFPDHTIDIPNPSNTQRHAVPNACGVCHANRSADQLQASMKTWWPDVEARQARRSRLADAVDEHTRDASLNALTAVVSDRAEASTLRGAAAVLLAQRFPSQASAKLVPLLRDPDPLVRTRLIESIGYANARNAADSVAAYTNDPSVPVRQMVALVLASFDDPRGMPAIQALTSDPKTRALVRPHIVLAINAAKHNDLGRAKQELELAVTEVPYLPDALVMLADISMRNHDAARARAWIEEALRFAPDHRGAKQRLSALQHM